MLHITDLETGDTIAVHECSAEKGRVIKNNHHYRDHAQRIADLEQAIMVLVSTDIGQVLCAVLKRTSPRIYKDQLVAVRTLLQEHMPVDRDLLASLSQRHELTASMLKRYLQANGQAKQRGRIVQEQSLNPILDLGAYAHVGYSAGQERLHEPA